MERIDELFADARDNTSLTDPTDIAERILKQLSSKERREILPMLIRNWVVKKLTMDRMPTSHGHAEDQNRSASRRPSIGTRVAAIRNSDWNSLLTQRVYITGKVRGWVMLGDCGVDDLLTLAESRRHMSRQFSANAEKFEKLAAALQESGKSKLSEFKYSPLPRIEGVLS